MAYYYPAWVYAFSAVVTGGTFWLFGKAGIIVLLVLVVLDQLLYRVRYGLVRLGDIRGARRLLRFRLV